MELHELRCFKAVVEEGSILKASIKLHMSQPPLSRMMKQLEETLQTKLFERGKRITLTETGKLLYERTCLLLDLEENTIKDVNFLEKQNEITLQLGIVSSSTHLLYHHRIEAFHQLYPSVHFNIKEANTFQLVELLNQKVIDLAIIRSPYDFSNFNSAFLKSEPMTVLSKNKTFKDTITIKNLDRKPIIIYRRFKSTINKLFQEKHVEMNIMAEVDDAKTAILLASTNLGYAIVPESAAKTFEHLKLYTSILDEDQLKTSLGIIYRKNEPLKSIYQSLIDILLAA